MHTTARKFVRKETISTIFCIVANILVIGAAVLWWTSMWRLRNPSPYADDFDSCIGFLSDWVETKNWQLLIGIHNEHTQLLLRLLVLFNYQLLKLLSFSFLTAWSITSPILFSSLFGCYLQYKLKLRWSQVGIWVLPCILLTSQPGVWGSYLWVTSGLTHGFMPFLILAALFAFECKYY